MNLEDIEQKCLTYLAEVRNPLVSFSTLMQHVTEDENCPPISESELMDFLSHHEEVRVFEAGMPGNEPGSEEAAALLGGPTVILESRIPTQAEMSALIEGKLEEITASLSKALSEAQRFGNTEMSDRLLEILSRTEQLQKKSKDLF